MPTKEHHRKTPHQACVARELRGHKGQSLEQAQRRFAKAQKHCAGVGTKRASRRTTRRRAG